MTKLFLSVKFNIECLHKECGQKKEVVNGSKESKEESDKEESEKEESHKEKSNEEESHKEKEKVAFASV